MWVRLVVSLLSLAALVGSGLAWAAYQNISAKIGHGASLPKYTGADVDGAAQNILLLGNDSREGASAAELKALGTTQDGGSIATDTIMLLHIPSGKGHPTIVSFPRDSWVSIPGYGKAKINAAYSDGYGSAKGSGADETASENKGILVLNDTIQSLTGLHIDHYMQVNLLGFYRISQAIGGVDICLNAAQNASTDSDGFGHGYSGINLPAGRSVIEGTQALAFVRQRHGLPRGDLDRIRRQQYFLSAAFKKIASAGVLLNPFKLNALVDAVSSSVVTDPGLNLAQLAMQFQDLAAGNITFTTIPNNGTQMIYPDGVPTSVVSIDQAGITGFINVLQGKPADPDLAAVAASDPGTSTVDVLNATSVAGLATRNAGALKKLGFHVDTVDSADQLPKTTIEYPAGARAEAKALQAAVPGAVMQLTSSVDRATLLLGGNDVQVSGLSVPAPAATAAPAATPASPASNAATAACIN